MLVVAVVLLLLMGGRAAEKNTVEGLVVPDNISAQQPFSFAVSQTIEGEVVDIKTIHGEVVQHASADKYGRIFLAAGLPAGAYLISAGSHGQRIGNLEIKPQVVEALQHISQTMRVENPPQTLKLSEPFSLSGHGFGPNFAGTQVSLTASGDTESPIVLAATEDQLKLAPVRQLQPGLTELRITDRVTGERAEYQHVLLYDIQAHLEKRKLISGGDQTLLVVKTLPEDLPMRVRTTVVSGPVDFGGGEKETDSVTSNGQAVFPVHAEQSSGPFQLTWQLAPHQRHDDCQCNMKTARCDIPDAGNVCWEWQQKDGMWACGSL
jgi:hypothetical protein